MILDTSIMSKWLISLAVDVVADRMKGKDILHAWITLPEN
jgi:hypothetical protein